MGSIPVRVEPIPQTLKDLKNWVVWRYDEVDGRQTKVLYEAKRNVKAKSNDPETWSSFMDAISTYLFGGWEGVGFVFADEDGIIGIDLDNCRNPETGEWAPWARQIIEKIDSYTEVSPSGTGAKIFITGRNVFSKGVNRKVDQMPMVPGKDPGIEVYSWGRYFAVTGRKLTRCPATVNDRTEQLQWLADTYLKEERPEIKADDFLRSPVTERAAKYLERMPPSVSGQNGSKICFRAACVLVLEFALSVQEAYPILKAWSDSTAQPPWSDKELMHKLEDADRQPGLRGKLRTATQRDYDLIQIPDYQEPRARKQEKTQPEIKQTMLKDAALSYLDRVVTGSAKMFDLGLPEIDYAIGGGVEAGEMILFAGRPNHGKSTSLQQAAYTFCRNSIPSLIISEEMSPLALGKRAIHSASPIPKENWQYRDGVVREEIERFFDGMAPCYIVENCRTAERVTEEIKKYVHEFGVGFVGIDYAQKLTTGDKNRYADITRVSMALKDAIKDAGIPGMVLAQMSRAIETRPRFVPMMSDLKDTGQFEADADVIVFQVWPHRLDPEKPADEYKFYVVKNRNREINTPIVTCKFLPSRQMFVPFSANDVSDDQRQATYEMELPKSWGFSSDPLL